MESGIACGLKPEIHFDARQTERPSVWPDLLVEFQRSINSMLAYWHARGPSKITVMGIEDQLKKVKIPGPSALALSLTFCKTSFELADLTTHCPGNKQKEH